MSQEREAGFGLVELLWATAVTSIGVLALAGVGLAIGEAGRLARWDTDASLVARQAQEDARAVGYAGATSGSSANRLGSRTYAVRRTVRSVTSRLGEVHVRVTSPGRGPADVTTRIAASRPLPVAP